MQKKRKTDWQVTPARPGDGVQLAAVLRAQDRAELSATHPGQDPAECLEKFIAASSVSVCVKDGTQPVLLAGVYHPYVQVPCALVWLLSGEKVARRPIAFFKLARFFLHAWTQYYGELFNYVDARYGAALLFAKRLGGILQNDTTYFSGKLFLKCTFRRNTWEE